MVEKDSIDASAHVNNKEDLLKCKFKGWLKRKLKLMNFMQK